jgi:hypothetical protein
LQGGFVPSWHTTVVLELSSGTTTVVVCEGAGGLLLLMHPVRTGIRINTLAKTFIMISSDNRTATLVLG